ncbi:hypothetical protein [Streptomyces sp. NPDC094049]|uniref:hypothetical protein n=1 Tax=Streptomyces sp. NPDC094049 TaxID=3154987 RepID=UPI003317FED3
MSSGARRDAAKQARTGPAGTVSPRQQTSRSCARSDVIISLCPPANAIEVAEAVATESFPGIYVDANAIAPASMEQIGNLLMPSAAAVVDGAVVGSPPSETKRPRLYLSGPEEPAATVAQLFRGSAVQPFILEGGIGKASALKLAYTSYQKASAYATTAWRRNSSTSPEAARPAT